MLIIPALNEAGGLPPTVEEFRRVAFRPSESTPDLLVVDGHSTDGTPDVAKALGLPVLVQSGKGKGAAVREGLAWGAEHGYETMAVIDADGTYPSAALPALFDLLEHGRDVAIGIRRPDGPPLASLRDLIHRIGNGALAYAAAQFSGKPILDVCSGLWGLRASVLGPLALSSNGFEIESELFVRAFRLGLSVAQFPVIYKPRVGEAKLHTVRDGSKILLSILRTALQRLPSRPVTIHRHPSVVAEVQSLLLGVGSERVLLLSTADRRAEADRLAKDLARAAPELEVASASVPPDARSLFSASWFPSTTTLQAGLAPPVVVALPARADMPGDPGAMLVGVPRSQRFVVVPNGGGASGWSRKRIPIALDGFRPERCPSGRTGAWFILSAVIEPSGRQRELALLEANADGQPVAFFRREVPAGPVESLVPPMVRRSALGRPFVTAA